MRLPRISLWSTKNAAVLAGFMALAVPAFASEGGVKAAAEPLFHLGPLPITNSMVMSWIIAIALVVGIRLAIKTPRLVPSRGQAVVEGVVQGILDLVAPIVGKKAVKAAFPLLVGLFVFILIQNWSGMLPGVGSIAKYDHEENAWVELFRPGNADMNGTIALAVISMGAWLYLILRYAGPKFIFIDLFGNKADKKEIPAALYYFLFVIFFAVGVIEIVSILFRPISLSFRLFGNVFGGENLLSSMSAITRWGLPVPFYFLEVLIGFVQAFVFTLLVSVYIGLICNHGGDEHDHAEAGAEHPAKEPGGAH